MIRNLIVVALALLIGACSLFPKYKRPEVKTPDAYRGQPAAPDAKFVVL